ncbi:hypothetical protein MJI69_31845, partial [Salmonella enterica subsp. enterica serovar Anatum]|nr:hypothetical protein [Salmonella enterica subsp. enterica serovar Anatum]
AEDLQPFDEAILACGIVPRRPPIDGIDHPKVLTYLEVLRDKAWAMDNDAPKPYQAGTWGPVASVAMITRDGRSWNEFE